jgi:DNA gyrase subunit B
VSEDLLSAIDCIRRRPGMWLGDVHDGSGLVHMIWELVANGLDEHLAGHCRSISVEIRADGAAVVEDDGRGISMRDVAGVPFAQLALTTYHPTPTLDGHAPHEHIGLKGAGLMPVNAVSSWLTLDSFHGGQHYAQRYERGLPVSPPAVLEPTGRSGTRIAFLPDPKIFSDTWINPGTVAARLRELAWLLPALTLSFADRREHRFHDPRGLHGFLERTLTAEEAPDAVRLTVNARQGTIGVETAMHWLPHPWSYIASYANIEPTTEGGTHVRGLLDGLADGLRAAGFSATKGAKLAHLRLSVQHGLHAVVCVRLQDPTYGAPSRDRLDTPEAAQAVRSTVAPAFQALLRREPRLLERLLEALRAQKRTA